MSLLNDMLKDLNRNKSRPASVSLPDIKSNWLKKLPLLLFTSTLLLIIACFIFALMRSSKPITVLKKDPPSPTLTNTSSVILNKKPQQSVPTVLDLPRSNTDFFSNNDSNESPFSSEKTINYSEKEWLNEHLNKALEAVQEGNDQLAIDQLNRILNKFPGSVSARENLAAIYLSHEELSNAYETLDEGLQLKPHNLRLTIMKARLLAEEGNQQDALNLLEKFNPDINKSPEYYALLAAIFESLGRTNEAGSVYQTLVRLDPANGQYWLGLAIALEAKHSNQQAIEAYKRASQSVNIQAEVRSYAQNRLKTLQG